MGDLLRQGAQWLEQQRNAYCSSPVTYRRGTTEIAVNATYGQTEYEIDNESGIRVGAQVTDFLILAEDFPLDEPQAGDQIVTETAIYEVMALGGEKHWRWSDPYRVTMRIHTREIGTT